jgi:hypothetical protein
VQALFERIVEQTFGVSEGIWLGTPFLTASAKVASLSAACRTSTIRTWCCGANATAGLRLMT